MPDDHDLEHEIQRVDIFKFELNRSQRVIVEVFALTGLFLLPVLLGGEIFFNLFNGLFRYLPSYLSDSEHYADLYLFYSFFPNIGNLFIFSLFFYFSFITVRKNLGGLGGEGSQKFKIIPQDRIVRWFGLKLSHGQAIFIFSLSLVGILFLTLEILETIIETIGSNYPPFGTHFGGFLFIPTGLNRFSSNIILLNNLPLIFNGLFLVLCLYSIFAMRKRKESHSTQLKTTSNLGLFVFIGSFFIFLLYLMRLLLHLFMFTDLAHLIGITKETTNIYQFNDFLNVIIILIGSLSFLVSSYFLKKRIKNVQKEIENLTWFHVKLTKNRYIMLLSYTIMYSCLLGFIIGGQFFYYGSWALFVEVIIILSILFLLILYSFIKISSKNVFQRTLSQFNDSEDFKAKWAKIKVNRLQSVILCSISSGAMFFYIFEMVTFRATFQFTELTYLDMFFFVQVIIMLIFLSVLLLFALYTIKCTYKAVKSR